MNLDIKKNIDKKIEQKKTNNHIVLSKILLTDENLLKHKIVIKDIKNSVWKKINY